MDLTYLLQHSLSLFRVHGSTHSLFFDFFDSFDVAVAACSIGGSSLANV